MENNEQVVKQKSNKGLIVLIVILILMVLGLSGYLVYNKFIAKDTEPKTVDKSDNSLDNETKEDKTIEYASIDGKEYLKLKEDNTYELKYNMSGTLKEKSGIYKTSNNGYLLDEKYNAIVTNDIIEIEDILSEESLKSNLILFNKKSIESIKETINNSVTNEIKVREQLWKKNNPQVAEVQKVEVNTSQCMRYAFDGGQINKDNIVCSISYNSYLKDYDYETCKNELSNSDKEMKFALYAISSGQCEKEYVNNWSFFSLDLNNNYKVLGTFTGL